MYTACSERRSPEPPHPVINDQTIMLVNFEDFFLFSPSVAAVRGMLLHGHDLEMPRLFKGGTGPNFSNL